MDNFGLAFSSIFLPNLQFAELFGYFWGDFFEKKFFDHPKIDFSTNYQFPHLRMINCEVKKILEPELPITRGHCRGSVLKMVVFNDICMLNFFFTLLKSLFSANYQFFH